MKKNIYLIFIAVGITAFIIGVFIYQRTDIAELTKSENTELYDLILQSDGFVNATVSYPTELLAKEEGQITLKVVPDNKIKAVLDKGLTIDSQLATSKLSVSSERRQFVSISASGTELSWTIRGANVGPSRAKLSLGLTDSRTDPSLYPLVAQHHFEFDIPIVESKAKAKFSDYIGQIVMGIGGVLLIAGFVLAYKDFDEATRRPKKKKR